MKKLVAVLLVLVLGSVTLTACGGGGQTLSGTYNLVSLESDGQVIEQEMLETLGMQDFIAFEFSTDGTVTVSALGESAEAATYTINGSTIAITSAGETIEGTIDGDTITIEIEGQKMVLGKK